MISVKEAQTASGHSIGLLRLNAPQALNALSLEMVTDAFEQLDHWATQRTDIVCVILSGEGRSFCAGGDVRRMRRGILDGDDYCARFFAAEYRLDQYIHRYPKPVIALGHGPVMGGGLGLFIGASHRVAAASCQFAMPELSIGLYPDVGASYFLNQLPAGLGPLLAVTGAKWNAADAKTWHMADYCIDDQWLPQIAERFTAAHWQADSQADRQQAHALLKALPEAEVAADLSRYSEHFQALATLALPELEQAIAALALPSAALEQALASMRAGCPTSKAIAVEQLARGKHLSLEQALEMEWGLSMACCERPEFPEGVRAQLVDKDRAPRWRYPDSASVAPDYIAAHFAERADLPLFDWH